MSELYKRNIHGGRIDYATLSLLSNKISVLIIGGGRAGYIKTKSLLKKGMSVTLVSENLNTDFDTLPHKDRFRYIKGVYKEGLVDKFHLVVIATGNKDDHESIGRECNSKSKLYIDCKDFKDGNVSIPVNGDTQSVHFSIQTREGSPKTSKFISKIVSDHMEKYDEYIDFSVNLRNMLKNDPQKNEIIDFVSTRDFMEMYKAHKAITILKTFYGGEKFDFEYSNKKK